MENEMFQSDRIRSYFKIEWKVLLAVTISGLIYNLGLLAGPWFEGKMTGCLVDILKGKGQFSDMAVLVFSYVTTIAVVQISRYIKRFYVRRFANDVNRRMKEILYGSLVRKSRASLQQEGGGDILTKAILDVDDCAEGMRKFTTEIFDTGVALLAYAGMLLWYDWRLALLCMLFPPISYVTAEKMKKMIQRTGVAYKKQSGILSAATMDWANNAITYRVFGCEKERQQAYEENLTAYEKSAVRANIWNTAMPPVYRIISMTGVLFILYFGQKNILGTGWKTWNIAAFTTFLTCFVKLSVKSSSAAKLFNAVHKAQVSWNRIRPLMSPQPETDEEKENKMKEAKSARHVSTEQKEKDKDTELESIKQNSNNERRKENQKQKAEEKRNTAHDTKISMAESTGTAQTELQVQHLNFAYPGGKKILDDISFTAKQGQVIGITGTVACGKSTLGKAFLCEYPYEGQITVDGKELQKMGQKERADLIGYLGHDPELFFDSVENNVLLGDQKDTEVYLKAVCMDEEVAEMNDGDQTMVGNGGVRLSGGQAQRLALARTLCHKKPILILDDPFSALDKNTEKQIFAHLREMSRENIVLLISHRLYLFPQMDQVLWMEQGKIISGTHEQIMEQVPEYADLFISQENKENLQENRISVREEKTEQKMRGKKKNRSVRR